ncbi:oligosaccharide flippase family protein [soil metagenome]
MLLLRNNTSYKRSFYILSGKMLPVLMLFIISVLYSRKLNFSEYGQFQSIWMYANVVNVITAFGFTSLIFSTDINYLLSFIKQKRKGVSVFYLLVTLIVFAVFYFFAKNFSQTLKIWLLIFFIIQNCSFFAEAYLIKQRKESYSFVINIIYAVLFTGWHIYILYIGFQISALIEGTTVITLVKTILIIFLFDKNKKNNISGDEANTFQKHWFFIGINDIVGVFSKWMDKIFLLYILTAADFAIFFNGSFEIPLFGLLISVAGSILLLEISANRSKQALVIKSFNKTYLVLSSIVFPLFIFLLLYASELFAVMFNNKYNASVPVFMISIFILPLRINNYSALLQCYSKGDVIMKGSLLDIGLAVILMVGLYPIMGTRGIALAMVVATYIQVLYYLWMSSKILRVNIQQLLPFKVLVIKLFVIVSVIATVYYLVPFTNVYLKLLSGGVITLLCIFTSLFYFHKKEYNKYDVQETR